MGLRGLEIVGASLVVFAEGRFYHGGDVFTESLNDIPLVDTCGTVGRLDRAQVDSDIDELHVGRGRMS